MAMSFTLCRFEGMLGREVIIWSIMVVLLQIHMSELDTFGAMADTCT